MLFLSHSGIEVLEVENPKTEDGKVFVAPNIFPLGVLTNYSGVSDDIENGIRGGGELLLISSASVGDTSKYFRYLDWNFLAGGNVIYTGADFGDWCSFLISAPKTEGISNPGHGMFNKYPVREGLNKASSTANSSPPSGPPRRPRAPRAAAARR